MTTPTDKQMVRMMGWPAGIDNRSAEQALQRDDQGRAVIALRDAENVDLDKSGKPARREGYARVLAATRMHSVWSDPDNFPLALYEDNGELFALRDDLSSFPLLSGLDPNRPLSYDVAAGKCYWSNGAVNGAVSGDGIALPWGVEGPNGEPTLTAGSGIGGLSAGAYQIAVTFLTAAGEESGASLAVSADVPEGGGLTLTAIPQPPDASYKIRIYRSGANGDVLYHAIDVPHGTSTLLLGASRLGKPLETQFLEPMPPGQIVRRFAGRLWVMGGNVLTYSEPLRYGLTDPSVNTKSFAARGDLLEPVGDGGAGSGLYVAAGNRTYFLAGSNPAQMTPAIKYPHGVVPGSAVRVPASVFGLQSTDPVPYWLATNGVGCIGLPDGVIVPVREGQTIAPSASAAASLYRAGDGMRQVITALVGASPRGMAMGDKLDCEVIRHDQ